MTCETDGGEDRMNEKFKNICNKVRELIEPNFVFCIAED